MCSLPDRTEPDSESGIEFEDLPFEESSGWEDEFNIDRYIQNKNLDKSLIKKIINKANKSITLSSVLNRYNINWIISSNPSGWTHKACCPFPDHDDRTPSFGFNSRDERFFCFGCKKSGMAVQFLAAMEGKSFFQTAKEILAKESVSDENIIIELDESHSEKIYSLLDDFSQQVREFIVSHRENPKVLDFVEKITWSIDVYIESNALSGSLKIETVEAILEKLKEHLRSFNA